MIDALVRAHYVRYDERSATRLAYIAATVRDEYRGYLRDLAAAGWRDSIGVKRLLKQFKGIGDTGADIFLREVQDLWTWGAAVLRQEGDRLGAQTRHAGRRRDAFGADATHEREAGRRAHPRVARRRSAREGDRLTNVL